MKFKTKQAEIDWLHSEMEAYRKDLKQAYADEADAKEMARKAEIVCNRVTSFVFGVTPYDTECEIGEVVESLVKNHESYKKLVAVRRRGAERTVKDAERLKACLMFIARCTCTSSGATYVGVGKALNITIDEIMRRACTEIDSLMAGTKGVVNGCQDSMMVDHVEELIKKANEPPLRNPDR